MKKFISLLLLSSLFVLGCQKAEEPVETPDTGMVQFLSPELGLSFEYSRMGNGGEAINVAVEGNKVILWEGDERGNFTHEIEVLDRTEDTVEDSIRALFVGTTADKCDTQEKNEEGLPSGVTQYGTRVTDPNLGLDYDCGTYVRNGVAFFLADEDAPSRMMYIAIGQDSFMTDFEWWKTIQLEDSAEM